MRQRGERILSTQPRFGSEGGILTGETPSPDRLEATTRDRTIAQPFFALLTVPRLARTQRPTTLAAVLPKPLEAYAPRRAAQQLERTRKPTPLLLP